MHFQVEAEENLAAWGRLLVGKTRNTIKKHYLVLGAVREAGSFSGKGVFYHVDNFMKQGFMRRVRDRYLDQAGL